MGHYKVLFNRRARLGVNVNLRARMTDSIGAYLSSVTPGGPAAKAGIKSGDIVTKLDGTSLLSGTSSADQDESAPGLRLIELAAKLGPNDTVAVELRRGKETKTVSLVTAEDEGWSSDGSGNSYSFSFDGPPGAEKGFEWNGAPMDRLKRQMDESGNFFKVRGDRMRESPLMMMLGGPLEDVELAPINPDLGRYFGVTDGILVISVPDDSKLNLKGGDVVLSVDGRTPSSPSHLLRILQSYEPGEEFKMEVMRMKKKETVAGKVGEKEKASGER